MSQDHDSCAQQAETRDDLAAELDAVHVGSNEAPRAQVNGVNLRHQTRDTAAPMSEHPWDVDHDKMEHKTELNSSGNEVIASSNRHQSSLMRMPTL